MLTEAKNANIPVIVVDRSVSADPSLYAAHIGSATSTSHPPAPSNSGRSGSGAASWGSRRTQIMP